MIVSQHAIDAYRNRSGCSPRRSDIWIKNRIRLIVDNKREWVVKPHKRLMQLLMHECHEAKYYKLNGLMAVVVGDTVVTVHTANASRWVPKPDSVSIQH